MTRMERVKRMNFTDDGSQMMMGRMMLLSFRSLEPITRTGLAGKTNPEVRKYNNYVMFCSLIVPQFVKSFLWYQGTGQIHVSGSLLCSCFGSQQLPHQSKRAASNHIVVLYPGIVHVSGNRVGKQFLLAAEHEANTLTSLLNQILRTRLCVMPFRCIYLQREDSEILMPCSSSSSCNSSRYRSGCCSRTPRRYYIDV